MTCTFSINVNWCIVDFLRWSLRILCNYVGSIGMKIIQKYFTTQHKCLKNDTWPKNTNFFFFCKLGCLRACLVTKFKQQFSNHSTKHPLKLFKHLTIPLGACSLTCPTRPKRTEILKLVPFGFQFRHSQLNTSDCITVPRMCYPPHYPKIQLNSMSLRMPTSFEINLLKASSNLCMQGCSIVPLSYQTHYNQNRLFQVI